MLPRALLIRRASSVMALVLAVLAATLTVALVPIVGVGAQQPAPTPPSTAGSPNTWALAPTGEDPRQPSSRPYFSYELAPGASVRDSVTLWNYSEADQTFTIYAKDAFNTAEGGFDILAADKASTDVGGWLTLEQSTVRVPARSGLAVPFTLTVPANATPGDHAAGVVASLATTGTPGDGRNVLVDHRVGSRVYLRVPGALDPSLTIDDVVVGYQPVVNPIGSGDLDVTFTITNAGNIRLKGNQKVTISGPLGRVLDERVLEDLPELLPGTSVRRTERFQVPPLVRLSADVTVTPVVGAGRPGDEAPESTTRSASVWAIPWTFLALVAVAIIAWRVRARMRRGRARPSSVVAGGGPGSGDDAGSVGASGGADRRDRGADAGAVPVGSGASD